MKHLTPLLIIGLIGFIGVEVGAAGAKGEPNALRKGYRYSKVTTAAAVEDITTAKVREVSKIPIRHRTKKPVAGILYAPTSTVTEQSKETAGYKYVKGVTSAAPTPLHSESPHNIPTVISTTRSTLPPFESSTTTSTTTSTSSTTTSLPSTLPTTSYTHKPSTIQTTYKPPSSQTNGYTYNKSPSSPRAAITLGYQKQSPSTKSSTTTTTTTASRRSAAGKGYRHNNSNTVNKIVPIVSSEPQTTQTSVTKKIHRGRGGYKYKIPEGIKPTDDGYVYNKVVKRQ